MVDARTIELVTPLTGDPDLRCAAALALARYLGAGDLLFFVHDPELNTPLPALGFPQTLHGGRFWRAFVYACLAEGAAQGELDYPTAIDHRTVRAWSAADQTVLVLLDGSPHDERVAEVRCLLPFLGALFRRERLAFSAAGQARVARESAAHAKELTDALESARAELQAALAVQEQQISERKKAEEKLADANADLERFAHTAAHDLQEPLRTITSYVQLLSRRFKSELTGDGPIFLNFIADGAQRMHALIQALLNYAEASSGPIVFEPLDMELILRSAEENVRSALDETGAKLTHDRLPAIQGDSTQLVLLFQNILSNALKYRSQSTPRIHVSARFDGGMVAVSIRDNGIGIDPEYHEAVFVSFKRLHGREYSGTGLGLASCQRIVARHGGRIWVTSEVGKGSTFFVTLPRVKEH